MCHLDNQGRRVQDIVSRPRNDRMESKCGATWSMKGRCNVTPLDSIFIRVRSVMIPGDARGGGLGD